MTADVENAVNVEVEIKTSTGLHFNSQTNMGKVSYQFEEDLPAGTVITVKAGESEGNVDVPGFQGLAFTRDNKWVVGYVVGTTNRAVHIETSYGEVLDLEARANDGYFRTVLQTVPKLEGFDINLSVAGATGVIEVPAIATTLTDVVYNVAENTVTGKTNREQVRVVTSTGVDVTLDVTNDQFIYAFPQPLANDDLITVIAGMLNHQITVSGVPGGETEIREFAFDPTENSVTGYTASNSVFIEFSTGFSDRIDVGGGFFRYTHWQRIPNGITITASTPLNERSSVVTSGVALVTNIVYNHETNLITADVSVNTDIRCTTSKGTVTAAVNNGKFQYEPEGGVLPSGEIIYFHQGQVEAATFTVDYAPPATLENVAFDAENNVITGYSNQAHVWIQSGSYTGTANTNPDDGRFQFILGIQPTAGDVVTASVPGKDVNITVETYLSNVGFSWPDQQVYGYTNRNTVTVSTSTGQTHDVPTSNGGFDYTFNPALPAGTVVTVLAGDLTQTVTVEQEVEITDLLFSAVNNSVEGNTSAPSVSVSVGGSVVAENVPVENGGFAYVFPTRLGNRQSITIREPGGVEAYITTSGVAEVSGITYDHRTNQILADLDGTTEVTLTGPFSGVDLTATNGKVGHIPEVVLQGNDVIQFKQGLQLAAEYTIQPLTIVNEFEVPAEGHELVINDGNGQQFFFLNKGALRYSYATIDWSVTGFAGATMDDDGVLTVVGLTNEVAGTPIEITCTADGHVTKINCTIVYGEAV